MQSLLAVAWLVRAHHARLRVEGDAPGCVAEVTGWFTNAAELHLDLGARGGFYVLAGDGAELGYLSRTLPQAERVIGYCGITDTLVALDREGRVLGFRIRKSEDTKTHVGDVMADRHFKKTWTGMTWEEVAGMDLKKAGVEGVSGATMTSPEVMTGNASVLECGRVLTFQNDAVCPSFSRVQTVRQASVHHRSTNDQASRHRLASRPRSDFPEPRLVRQLPAAGAGVSARSA